MAEDRGGYSLRDIVDPPDVASEHVGSIQRTTYFSDRCRAAKSKTISAYNGNCDQTGYAGITLRVFWDDCNDKIENDGSSRYS